MTASGSDWFVKVRCPGCGRLIALAAPGSRLQPKCPKCHRIFEAVVGADGRVARR